MNGEGASTAEIQASAVFLAQFAGFGLSCMDTQSFFFWSESLFVRRGGDVFLPGLIDFFNFAGVLNSYSYQVDTLAGAV